MWQCRRQLIWYYTKKNHDILGFSDEMLGQHHSHFLRRRQPSEGEPHGEGLPTNTDWFCDSRQNDTAT